VLPVVGDRPAGNGTDVTAEEPRRLGLELRFEVEPIQGRLYDKTGHTGLDRPFLSWLGLLSALETARGNRPAGTWEAEREGGPR
jgi:hypothetical protein